MKVKAVIRKAKADKKGECPVYIRQTIKGRQSYMSVGYKVPDYLWDDDRGKVRAEHPQSEDVNFEIDQKIRAIMEAPSEERVSNKKEFNDGRTARTCLEKLAEKRMSDFRKRRAHRYVRTIKDTIGQWKKLMGTTDLKAITHVTIREFLSKMDEAGYSHASKKTRLAVLKAIFNHAVDNDIISAENNPFIKAKRLKITGKKGKKETLSLSEIKKIKQKAKELSDRERCCIDCFLFSFHAGGIRATDAISLKWGNIVGDRIVYTMHKNQKNQSLPLTEEAMAILDRYRGNEGEYIFQSIAGRLNGVEGRSSMYFQRLSTINALINRVLDKVCKNLGINKKVTFHVARHSIASHFADQGVDIRTIQNILKHSSIGTTEDYLRELSQKEVDSAFTSAFNKKTGGDQTPDPTTNQNLAQLVVKIPAYAGQQEE